jgi:hypothetical protein
VVSTKERNMSVKGFNPTFHRQPDIVEFCGMLEGAGAAAMTAKEGTGFTFPAYAAVGKHGIVLQDTVQSIVSVVFAFGDATDAAAVNGFTCSFIELAADKKTIEFWIYDEADALADLAATSYLTFIIKARNTSLTR